MNNLYVDVILPVPLHLQFTYRLKKEQYGRAQVGNRAIVQFGKKRIYTALIYKIYENESEEEVQIKDIIDVLDDTPIVNMHQLRLWEWISTYYICSLGDVYRAALPTSLKLESETFVGLNSQQMLDDVILQSLTAMEYTIIQVLQQKGTNSFTRISDLEKSCLTKNIIGAITSLEQKGLICVEETLEQDYHDKEEDIIRLHKSFTENELISLLEQLKRSPKQYKALIDFIALEKEFIVKKEFITQTNTSNNIIKELVNKHILKIDKQRVFRQNFNNISLTPLKKLSEEQDIALNDIKKSFETYDISLLHGVTGSGKTEVYIHLIQEAIKQDKQVLYLLPEIALTKQITDRLNQIFGNDLAVYHSKFNDKERAETWLKLKNKECKIILGARSAIFLPFSDLGLLIIDEEHESSYKQQDPAPRYNAKNSALVLANMFGAKTLLGTATPSLETYHSCLIGKYGMIQLSNRFNHVRLPEIIIENTRELKRKKIMKSILTPDLICDIRNTLENDRQVILFQNRRGFAPYIECKICGWNPRCNKCDVSLTFHKKASILVCHYCGGISKIPTSCPCCESNNLEAIGYGTERIEQEVQELFPEARISRMDLDTTRGKNSFERIISDFENNNTNILIGTQMVSKGLDFERVDIVGVINANNLLNYPNFRAYEKAFQLLTQVSGRAGRKNNTGKVYIQTTEEDNITIKYLKNNDLRSFYEEQLSERKLFHYPPYSRLIEIVLRSKDDQLLDENCKHLSNLLRQSFGSRVLGPSRPPVSRIQSLHIRKFLLKIEVEASVNRVRQIIKEIEAEFFTISPSKNILIHYDVDPL